MLKIAMAGKWHVHAEGYANDFNREPDAQVVCVWDDDEACGREWAGRLQVPFYASYAEMLKDSGCDAVCICSPTNMHRQIMIQAARAKKHIFTEKVMCLNVKDCDEAIREINENGVVFTISFPHRCFPQNLFIKHAIESGLIGKVTLFRVRNCHNGALAGWLPDYWYDPETTGGGAMMDLGAHPMYLSSWLLGEPASVQSCFRNLTGRQVEDDAVSVIRFKSDAVAVAETSLVAPYTPQTCEVYGTKGAILAQDGKVRVKTDSLQASEDGGWITPALPKALPTPIRQFIDSALYGKPVLFGTKEARALTVLMENAYAAHKQKREVEIKD
ncbi:MAG: Gfo/Idh/MocA family oxidoreductase [Clostridia bacterium]|nr:Gfo/Idh/MocA family oxidoreductase [Clostridia bacterium]